MTMESSLLTSHAAWLSDNVLVPLARRRVVVAAEGAVAATIGAEVASLPSASGVREPDLILTTTSAVNDATWRDTFGSALPFATEVAEQTDEASGGYAVGRRAGVTVVVADDDAELASGYFHVVRQGADAFGPDQDIERHEPVHALRMLDHWDNVDVNPFMGQVERGYAGGSIFYDNGEVRSDLSRVEQYARLLAASGINRVAINNVNVHEREARLLTDDLDHVARIAAAFRAWGIRLHLSVSFASPIMLGGLSTADPLDPDVNAWWAATTDQVYSVIPDFGGYVVKADSEGQPGPFAYDRDHADGANMLARALAPHGGLVHWRAFVYNHRQDWRDRSTDRARAAYDHFAPLDGRFEANVIVQVKYGPMDFQPREPISPVIAAMPRTRLAIELQVTQEYTGQQRHACYLGELWSEVLNFQLWGDDGPTLSDVAAGRGRSSAGHNKAAGGGGIAAVSNVGSDEFWTGHPLAQANLYALGRLSWDPSLTAQQVLDEWISLTFADRNASVDPAVRATITEIMLGSWHTYESYTAPLGVGFMVRPGHHYGPDVDGYEYTPWGTYHFADRDGIGVDRTRATGTGYTGQYPAPWRDIYESLETCPDELLLFFHHVPYTHVLHNGSTVIQHIYDSRAEGLERVEEMAAHWQSLVGHVAPDLFTRVSERFEEQLRSAREWRDQVRSYFFRKSGVPDSTGRIIY